MKKKILVIFPKNRDKRELAFFDEKYDIHFHDFDIETFRSFIYKKRSGKAIKPSLIVNEIKAYVIDNQIEGIVSTDDYPGSLFASVIAHELNLPAPTPMSVIFCQHKYLSRIAQKKYAPQATPKAYFIINDQNNLQQALPDIPFFIKPIKACFSMGAKKIESYETFLSYFKSNTLPAEFSAPLEWAIQNYSKLYISCNGYVAEEFLEGKKQATIEGYAHQGTIYTRGVVDSIMYPGTISFSRFEYPSKLPSVVLERMVNTTKAFMQGINFDNGMFNIEFMYNEKTDQVHIIEVNSRMASQFADIYEKVDGTNSYEIALNLALKNTPTCLSKQGKHNVAASFILRNFKDAKVIRTPSTNEIKKVFTLFPDARVTIIPKVGHFLSEYLQDGTSFRYCLLHLGGKSIQDLEKKYEECKQLLRFDFQYV